MFTNARLFTINKFTNARFDCMSIYFSVTFISTNGSLGPKIHDFVVKTRLNMLFSHKLLDKAIHITILSNAKQC